MTAVVTSTRGLMPASALPLAYYGTAHAGLAGALATLALDPSLPGASFYHPRFVALVHLLTLAWITGSILGSLYIVGPLALRIPMVVRRTDWIAFAAFVAGVVGMVGHFWIGTYDGMAWSAGLVLLPIARTGWLLASGLRQSSAPAAVLLHVGFAFFNILAAAALGMIIGFNRTRGFVTMSPLAATYAHAHLAAIGWAAMLVIGLSYRLIPMMLPASMPTGRSLALSAVLLESGLLIIVVALLSNSTWVAAGAIVVVAGFASFVTQLRGALKHRLPRPPALPTRDWSTWQTHAAFLWLLVAMVLGLILSTNAGGESRLTLTWAYGVAGLVGFLGQIIPGIAGRLFPLYAWYRAFARKGAPPERSAHDLPTPRFARPIFIAWAVGVPLFGCGLATTTEIATATGATTLLAAVFLGAVYFVSMLRTAGLPRTDAPGAGSGRGHSIGTLRHLVDAQHQPVEKDAHPKQSDR